MGSYLEREKVKKAIKKAKQLEKDRILTPKQELKIQKEMASFSEKLQNLLKPAWFVKDVHKKRSSKKAKKTRKKAVKKSSKQTKKKKK